MRGSFWLTTLALLVGLSGTAHAQAPVVSVPTDSFAWNVDEGIDAANRFTYTLEIDGNVHQGPLSVACSVVAGAALCVTPIPAVTPGQHVLRVQASELVDGTRLDSQFSTPLVFVMRVAPNTPKNPRIVRAGTVLAP